MKANLSMTSRSVLLLALVAAPRAAMAAPDEAEIKAFRETAERYGDRMTELQTEIRAIVDVTEEEERSRITKSFGAAMARVDSDAGTLRRVAVTKLESFLSKYPNTKYSADMKFRLADLYYEESELDFLARMDEYAALEAQASANSSIVLPEPPVKDYRKSIALYRDVVQNHSDYTYLPDTLYMLGWCLSAANAAQYDESGARDVYQAIVDRFPKSPFANDANMRLGEFYFDLPATREDPVANVRKALAYYNTVLADGPTGRNYDEAIYKLGWSHYKLNDYDRALSYLVQLLDYSDQQFARTGKVSSMRKEAVEYLAISYSDLADRQGRRPVDVAKSHLDKIGERKWEHDVVERLAALLLLQAKFEESVEAYRFLQTRWPLDPKNPIYQQEIALIYGKKMPVKSPEGYTAAMAELGVKYVEGTPWYNANKSNPDAIAAARGFIETSLADVAVADLARAKDTGKVEDYALAAAKLEDFLNKFPFANDYNEYEWYLGLAFYESNQFVKAERQYGQILKNQRSPYRDGARFQLMKSREQIVLAKHGKLEDVPQGAVVQNTTQTKSGQSVTEYMLSDEHKAFLASADDLVDREFSDPDWAGALDQSKPALAYIAAQVYYRHGYYEEARKRFQQVMARFKGREEAQFAFQELIGMLQQEGDLEGVLAAIKTNKGSFDLPVGDGGSVEEQATLALALKKGTAGDRLGAAQAYQDFLRDYPKSTYRDVALYNVGNNLDLGGKSEEANRYFEQFINEFPKHERAEALYFRIAQGYSSVLDLEKAVRYFEALPKVNSSHPDAPAALYNAAFLRTGMGDHRGSALAYQKYAELPGVTDAEKIYWKAGEQWELVGDKESMDFYKAYLAKFENSAASNPSHAIEARYKLSQLYAKKGQAAQASKELASLDAIFRANAGVGVSSDARKLAAEAPLKALLADLERFKVYKFGSSEKANVELVLKQKPEELKALQEKALLLIQTYQDYDAAAAALYVQGMAYFAYADMVYAVPPPPGLSDEEIVFYQEQLDPFRLRAEDTGKARLTAALEKARVDKRWSTWNGKALDALHERYPVEFPSERAESRGIVESAVIQMEGPATPAPKKAGGAK